LIGVLPRRQRRSAYSPDCPERRLVSG
jgi:hypothetical protein